MASMTAESIVEALGRELAACEELSALRAEQRRLIDAGEAEALLEVLRRKQQAINLITELEAHLKPVRAQWDASQGDYPASARFAIGDAFREVRDRLEKLIAQENEDAEALSRQKSQVQDELGTLGRKRRLEAVYGQGDGRGR